MPVCSRCGADNAQGQKFCGECGAALAAGPPPREERKVVTVLFTDLVGFTSRSEQLDPEDVRAMLSPYYLRLRREIERHGGTVEKFIGDAVMAAFGAPVAHEDDAERAVRAALAIREAIEELNAGREGSELAIRTGVNTGEALVALGARPSEGEGMVSGDVVNTAARLQAAAPVGGILVGETTYRATRHAIEYREAEPVEAKGKAEPVPVWEAVDARARFGVDVEERPAGAPALVGRERELGVLADALERCRTDETAQLVTLVGVPGIGKSRIVAELFRIVDAAPDLVGWRQGRSLPYGETQSFWALSEIVKAQAGILESDGTEAAAAKLAAAVQAAVPDERERAWVERHLQPLVGVAGAVDSTSDRGGEAFAAWRRLFEGLAEQRPLILVFEDLHWADEGLLDFVDHLAEWVTTVPLLLVATARPELLDRRPGWGGGKRNASTVSIAPLTEAEISRLLADLLEQALLPADVQSQVLARASGNPLYAEEYVRMLQERGFLRRSGGGWRLARADDLPLPETVQGMIAARLDALPPTEKELVQDAAVLGKVFWPSALAAFGGREPADLLASLHALERRDFVRRDRRSTVGNEQQYAFLHVLVRDVAYGQIPRSARADKHRAAAAWIEALSPDRAEDRAEMLAHHYRSALALVQAAGGDPAPLRAPARAALVAASERAEALYAWAAARDRGREALELTDAADPSLPQLALRVAWASFHLGVHDLEAATAAGARSLAAGDVERAAEAETLRSSVLWYRGEGTAAHATLDRALELVAERPTSPAKVWAHASRARYAYLSGDLGRARRLAIDALAMARDLGRDDYAAHALNTLGMARVTTGDAGGIDDVERSIELAERASSAHDILYGINNLANLLWALGRLEEATAQRGRHRKAAERFGMKALLVWGEAEASYDAYLRGAYDEMIERAERFLAEHEGRAHQQEGAQRNVLAQGYAATGRAAAALEQSELGLALARETRSSENVAYGLMGRALALSAAGRDPESATVVDEILADPVLLAHFVWLAPLPLLLAEQGRQRECLAVIEHAPPSPWRDAAVAVAEGRYAEAADAYGRIGSRFVEAWSRLLAAEAGDHSPARLAAAADYFRAIGAVHYLRRCDVLASASA
jgi:class 3 adenylate cyclase